MYLISSNYFICSNTTVKFILLANYFILYLEFTSIINDYPLCLREQACANVIQQVRAYLQVE
jgi:hypothetical protein